MRRPETSRDVAAADSVRSARPPGLSWEWSPAVLGALYALPAALVVIDDRSRGLALAVGVLPGAIIGLAPTRRARLATVVLGASIGVPMFVGGLLAGVPVIAVASVAILGVVSALLAARSRYGQIVMTLSLPMVGVGLSYSDIATAAGLAALMVLGSLFACLVSMLWPERPASRRPTPGGPTIDYGIRLGAAGATAAAIGFALDLEHVGWACAAALLVMRPTAEMQRLRSVGRIVAVAAGALAGIALVRLSPPAAVYSLAVIATIAGAAGTHRSHWYVTPAFTTFLVFLLLLYAQPETAAARFNERLLETMLGVALAYAYGLALPALMHRLHGSGSRTPTGA